MRFRYSQTVNTTTITFERPGSQVEVRDEGAGSEELAHSEGSAIPLEVYRSLSEKERAAVKIAAKRGKVTPRALADEAKTTRRTASETLRGLASKNLLLWSGKSANDPYQFYYLP